MLEWTNTEQLHVLNFVLYVCSYRFISNVKFPLKLIWLTVKLFNGHCSAFHAMPLLP